MKNVFSYFTYFLILTNTISKPISNISIGSKYIDSNTVTINIPKIGLKKNIYPYNDKENDVNKNIYLANDYNYNNLNGSLVLAAHSGNSNISFFDNIDNLNINDEIIIESDNSFISYLVIDKYLINKTGFFNYQDKDRRLYLITCSKKDRKKQLVIYAKTTKIVKKSAFF